MVRYVMFAACAAALCATSSVASTISGDFSGTISDPRGTHTTPIRIEGQNTDTLYWGTPNSTAKKVNKSDSSVLSVHGQSFDHKVSESGEILLGSISWVNHSNWFAGRRWSSVLSLDLDFDTIGGGESRSVQVGFNTYNSIDGSVNTSKNERTGNSPDEISGFYIDTSNLNLPIALDGGIKVMDIFFRLDDAGTPGTQTGFLHNGQASGSTYDQSTGLWVNREGGSSTIGVYASVAAVPLPAGLWLMLSGFGSFLLARRFKQKTA
ncbi:choice-of-anchor K domain-containing protein [Roseobacter litoralis]|uniref:choice-of-anchor K domain-containing protein n=1 Tax=Roseobacter litoralis TaxID=42443 RepID=UPI00249474E3|nr:choice-of-anchor K domain-containing protein [Roseobacter litoralis]